MSGVSDTTRFFLETLDVDHLRRRVGRFAGLALLLAGALVVAVFALERLSTHATRHAEARDRACGHYRHMNCGSEGIGLEDALEMCRRYAATCRQWVLLSSARSVLVDAWVGLYALALYLVFDMLPWQTIAGVVAVVFGLVWGLRQLHIDVDAALIALWETVGLRRKRD